MKKLLLFFLPLLFYYTNIFSQDKWDLRKCVDYAWNNHVSIKQARIQAKIDGFTYKQNKLSQYPNANFSNNTGFQFGRSIDPTTNQFTTSNLLFQSFNFQTNITIFNWNNIKSNILAAKYYEEASVEDVERAKNDIALTVATSYLQALLTREQVDVAEAQVQQTKSQLEDTRKRVSAGALPELNQVQLESQLAIDSSSLITAKETAEQNLLTLKANIYVDAAAPFDIAMPALDMIPVDPIAELQPDMVFQLAMKYQPAQKVNELRYKSLEATVKAVKSTMYPVIGAGGGLGTSFSSPGKEVTGINFLGYTPADPLGPVASVNGTNYPILTPSFTYTQRTKSLGGYWSGWGDQINNNFRQNIGVGITVPIFNGGVAKYNYERAKLNLESVKVLREQIDQTLKQNIYQAYSSCVAALQKYNSNQTSVTAAQKAFDFATKRYELGLLSTFELIQSQTTLTKSKIDLLTSHYDYVFKMKVLEFYKGQGIKL